MPEPENSENDIGEWKVFAFPGKTPQNLCKEEPGDIEAADSRTDKKAPKMFVAKFERLESSKL
jgi:hypothetical protein